jgi:cell division cycle protein 37
LPRIEEIHSNLVNQSLSVSPTVYFNSLVEQLQGNPSPDCPPGADSTKLEQTYDGMLLSLLKMVSEKAKEKVKQSDILGDEKDARLAKELGTEVATHVQQLGDTIDKNQKELDEEVKEQKKHITSDDLHDGFASKVSRSLYVLRILIQLINYSTFLRCLPRPRFHSPKRKSRKAK